MTVPQFDPSSFEKKWREEWDKNKVYHADLTSKRPFYNLWMFPYPSAEGVHVGTIFSSTGSDVYGRFKRMQGYEVFQPMGYDSFGIHSENFALKIGEPPAVFTKRAIANYERQFKEIGHGYDWERKVATSSPDYYEWTQWLFGQMFKAGLAYKKKSAVNWCPGCKTVLADEQIMSPAQAGKWPKQYATLEEVPDGLRVCERCGNEPERKELEQWFWRITKYADRLLDGLDKIDWSERVAVAQREWIGRKEGARVKFEIRSKFQNPNSNINFDVEVFTTRLDTIFGVTYLVVAPEVAKEWIDAGWVADGKVVEYVQKAINTSEQERKITEKEKTGIKTDLTAINPANAKEVPVYVADYVLKGVGTGVVMGVPGHDRRDYEFAKKHGLPAVQVVTSEQSISEFEVWEGDAGRLVNSEIYNGMDPQSARTNMFENGLGEKMKTYHLRDWLVSRQRYWGAPIPMIYCSNCKNTGKGQRDDMPGWYVDENLPIVLPEIDDYQPKGDGKGPLANHPEFFEAKCPVCGGKAERETDVMDTFVDSSWYFLRYPSANSGQVSWDPDITKKWLPVSLYFGGAEHSVLHLMYARFVTMALHDMGLVDFDEPFPRFFAHGLMIKDGAKMSKSKGNVVNPDEYIAKYGADALRLYLMFMGPMDGYPDFRDSGMEGMVKWLKRVWKLLMSEPIENNGLDGRINELVEKVTGYLESYKNNTAIAEMMKFVNMAEVAGGMTLSQIDIFVRLLSPFAPHMCEEVYQSLNSKFQDPNLKFESVHRSNWPVAKEMDIDEPVTIVVQVDGKVRGKVEWKSKRVEEREIVQEAIKNENVMKYVEGRDYRVVYVPGKLVNLVVN